MSTRIKPHKKVHRYAANSRRVRRNRPKLNYGLLAWIFVAAALVAGGVSYAFQTPELQIREVKISGVCLADAAAVKRAAKPALGTNILLLRKSPIVRDISKINEVAEVQVGRSFPNGVWVKVREKKASAVLANGCRYAMLRDDGFAFHAAKGPVKGIPTLEVAGCRRVKQGQLCCSQTVNCALEVAREARKRRLPVSKISVDHAGVICLNMEGGFYVKLGQPDDISRKMSLLRTALIRKPSLVRDAAYIDVSCPDAPVWKPRTSAGSAS